MSFDLPNLDSFFEAVDDYLAKEFRASTRFAIAVKSHAKRFNDGDGEIPLEKDEEAPSDSQQNVLVKFSPRYVIDKNGDISGKLKAGCTAETQLCSLYQRLMVDTQGRVIAKVTVEGKERDDGQQLSGDVGIQINTVAPPTEDAIECGVALQRSDIYTNVNLVKVAGGEGEVSAKFGARLFNGVLGLNVTSPFTNVTALSTDQMSAELGVGFAADAWSFAFKLCRNEASWSNAHVAMQRQDGKVTMVAKYELDLHNTSGAESHGGVVTMALSKRMRVHVPRIVQPLVVKSNFVPMDVGVMADTTGSVSVRGKTQWKSGLNLLLCATWPNAVGAFNSGRLPMPSFGLCLRFES